MHYIGYLLLGQRGVLVLERLPVRKPLYEMVYFHLVNAVMFLPALPGMVRIL